MVLLHRKVPQPLTIIRRGGMFSLATELVAPRHEALSETSANMHQSKFGRANEMHLGSAGRGVAVIHDEVV